MLSASMEAVRALVARSGATGAGARWLEVFTVFALFTALEALIIVPPSSTVLSRVWRRLLPGDRAKDPQAVDRAVRGAALRFTGLIHHLVVLVVSIAVLRQPGGWALPLTWNSKLSEDLLLFSSGYFMHDLYVSAREWLAGHEVFSFVYHGFLCGTLFSLAYVHSVWEFYCAMFLLWESSTPFVQGKWYLDQMGMRNHAIYLVNGLCLIGVFFACRIAWGTLAGYHLLSATSRALAGELPNAAPAWFTHAVRVLMPTLYLLNWWWFVKMMKFAIKALGGGKKKAKAG
ncbi:unnamed protein product [Pedinophyceae sp. YPF-701]|nr:unnamed protein product [Pedinophyceae sp. YPF-701]